MQSEWGLCLGSRPPAGSTLVAQVTFTPGKPRLLRQITMTPGRFAADPVLATHRRVSASLKRNLSTDFEHSREENRGRFSPRAGRRCIAVASCEDGVRVEQVVRFEHGLVAD